MTSSAAPSGGGPPETVSPGRAPGSAPPPSEKGSVEPGRRGVGVFRLAGWGWGVTIALALLVGVVIVIGYVRIDPGINPVPTAYRAAVCAAAEELRAGTEALARGVESRDDPAVRDEEGTQVVARVEAASDALAALPDWTPGRSLNELLAFQIITLTNGAGALEEGPVEEDLDAAQATDADIAQQLSSGRYGFDCGA